MSSWQQPEQFTIQDGETATFTLRPPSVLSNLTIWAVSGPRTLEDVEFQVQINGHAHGAAVTVTSAAAKTVVYDSSDKNYLIPFIRALDVGERDPFTLSVLISNDGEDPVTLTIFACAEAL